MSELKIGATNMFEVGKVDKDSVILKHPEATLEMPQKENTMSLAVGDSVEAFVYIDHAKGLVATTKTPYIDLYTPGFVKVVERKDFLGVFVDIGLSKDMLVSKDDLPHMKQWWPQVGDTLLCYLKTARKQMVARPVSRFDVNGVLTPSQPLSLDDTVQTVVLHIADEGLVTFSSEGHEVFVYYKHTRQTHRLGEALSVRITNVRDPKRYNGTLTKQKETMQEDDADIVYEYLQTHGEVNLGDKSEPTDIFATFNMSKAAFKRAIGKLYKDGKVTLEPTRTILKKQLKE